MPSAKRLTALFCTMHEGDRLLRMTREISNVDWRVAGNPAEVEARLPEAEILILNNRICTPELGVALRAARRDRLRWIHFISAGVEMGLSMGLPGHVPVTSSAGTNGPVLAEHAATLLLASMRRFNDIYRGQAAHEWRRLAIAGAIRSLEGAVVCILGLGAVGREVARKLRAFDAEVIAISRDGRDPNVSRVFPRDEIHAALRRADALVICANSDASTHHVIGAAELAAMKRGAFVVNMSRGELIDEPALIEALRAGHLGGAGLDVTEGEPPARDNPLWDLPNVILSPHVSGGGSGEAAYQRQAGLFVENLRRFEAGETLLNPVDLPPGATF
jgi:phosphoglycerate dehydrogenase-like enzyme